MQANRGSVPAKIDSVQNRHKLWMNRWKNRRRHWIKQKKNIQLQTQVYDLIDRQGILRGAWYSQFITGCDSLQNRVDDLIIQTNLQDSIQTAIADNLHEQLCKGFGYPAERFAVSATEQIIWNKALNNKTAGATGKILQEKI